MNNCSIPFEEVWDVVEQAIRMAPTTKEQEDLWMTVASRALICSEGFPDENNKVVIDYGRLRAKAAYIVEEIWETLNELDN